MVRITASDKKTRDFTLEKYQELCLTLKGKNNICTVVEYLTKKPKKNITILRHDVDRKILNALRMAKLECEMNIHSTYYFRYPYTFDPEIIQEIKNLGHEIGYHYEVLSKTKGDYEKAIDLFKFELTDFRKKFEIKTICMHGSPLSSFDNRSLWKHYDFQVFGIDGEAYLSISEENIQYFTDTGRSWNGKNSIRDIMPGSKVKSPQIETTDDLIDWINSTTKECIYLTVHPERWARNLGEWGVGYFKDFTMNQGKRFLSGIK